MAPRCKAILAAAHEVLEVWQIVAVADSNIGPQLACFVQFPERLRQQWGMKHQVRVIWE